MPLFASGVKVPDALSDSFSQIGQQGKQAISDNYAKAKTRFSSDSRGLRPGGPDVGPDSYAGQRMGIQRGLDTGALEASVGGQAGDAAYKDQIAQRDYEQQRQIAEEAANAARPDLLEQILTGVGGAANAGMQAASMYKQFGPKPAPNVNGPSMGRLSLWDDGNYGMPMYKGPMSAGGY